MSNDVKSFKELAEQAGLTPSQLELGSPPPAPLELSKRKRTVVRRSFEALTARRDQEQSLAFSPRDFVLCGLPYRQPFRTEFDANGKPIKKLATEHVRRNGPRVFKIVSDTQHGLPFGQDRLLAIWLATAFKAAGQPEDNKVRFRSASDILRALGQREDGGSCFRILREGLARLHASTFFAYDESEPERFHRKSYRLFEEAELWVSSKGAINQNTLWQNWIELNPTFANDLRNQAIPIDLQTIRAIKGSPAVLDLYIWQAHRSWRLSMEGKKHVHVSVFGESGLLAQLGCDVQHERKARQQLRRWHAEVRRVWPQCPNRLSEDGNQLILQPAQAVQPEAKLALPGVSPRPPAVRPRLEALRGTATADSPLVLLPTKAPLDE